MTLKIRCVGRNVSDQLHRDYGALIVGTIEDIAKPALTFDKAAAIGERIVAMFQAGEFDVCTLIYAEFRSAISQIVTPQQLIPFAPPKAKKQDGEEEVDRKSVESGKSVSEREDLGG